MTPINFDTDKLHTLFMEGVPILEISLEMEAAESEIHYAISQFRKQNPGKWPKRNSGNVKKSASEEPIKEAIKEHVKIEASFPRIMPLSGKANSDVVTRRMTPEEMDRLNGLKKQTTDSTGARIPKVHNYGRKPTPAEEPIQITNKEPIEMKSELTKELYLSEKAAGKNNAQIERDWNLKPNYIYQLLKKWGITVLPRIPDPAPTTALTPAAPAASTDDKLAAVHKYIRDLLGMDPVQVIYDQIAAERDRQDSLHPHFPREIRTDVLLEEVGEVAKAKLEGNQADLRKELIEVAAVAVRWVEMLDRESD